MFELVPSKYMRDYFQKVGFTFTDFQKATLIWNMPEKLWRERLDALRELAESTDDARTRRQITERVEAEKKKKRLFDENSDNRFVYVVEERNGYSCGFFASCEMAVEYAAKYVEEYQEYTAVCRRQQWDVKELENAAGVLSLRCKRKMNGKVRVGVV